MSHRTDRRSHVLAVVVGAVALTATTALPASAGSSVVLKGSCSKTQTETKPDKKHTGAIEAAFERGAKGSVHLRRVKWTLSNTVGNKSDVRFSVKDASGNTVLKYENGETGRGEWFHYPAEDKQKMPSGRTLHVKFEFVFDDRGVADVRCDGTTKTIKT
ncbi:hypothetical protein NLX83_27225 [Allokutzneria sp. A3M-2-11 16]|uniref:hypothetical protein n=1 Tax=Allokutzneria sp. A3M-2-11 16 TaxID=2962043 RepID=UPI0020B825E4|nr:hypothetical protein [Allokutzneria sp. A3M-2-11 16]MCP3802971.1 hypothetical protein [Allokutzneria sp. A3M-2-11 16]